MTVFLKPFFIILLIKPVKLWEQEIYYPFNFNKLNEKWFYFASETSNVAFSFSFSDEAVKFNKIFNEKYNDSIAIKTEKRLSKRLSKIQAARASHLIDLESTGQVVTETNSLISVQSIKHPNFYQPTINEDDESRAYFSTTLKPPAPVHTVSKQPISEPSISQASVSLKNEPLEPTLAPKVKLRPESELPSSINLAEAANISKTKSKFNSVKLRTKVNFNKLNNSEIFSVFTSPKKSDAFSKINAGGSGLLNKLNISGNEILSKFSISGPIETTLTGFKGIKRPPIGAPEGFKIVSHVAQTETDFECIISDENESIKIKEVLSDIKKNLNSVSVNKKIINPIIDSNPVISIKSDAVKKPTTDVNIETESFSVNDIILETEYKPVISINPNASKKQMTIDEPVTQEESFNYLKAALEQRMPYMGNYSFK